MREVLIERDCGTRRPHQGGCGETALSTGWKTCPQHHRGVVRWHCMMADSLTHSAAHSAPHKVTHSDRDGHHAQPVIGQSLSAGAEKTLKNIEQTVVLVCTVALSAAISAPTSKLSCAVCVRSLVAHWMTVSRFPIFPLARFLVPCGAHHHQSSWCRAAGAAAAARWQAMHAHWLQ